MPDYFSYRINFHSDGKIRGCLHYTVSLRIGKSYFHYRTSINCKNVLEYTHDNNTFIMLLTKIFIELYVTNVYIVAMIQIDEYLNTNFALSKGTVSLGYVFIRNRK